MLPDMRQADLRVGREYALTVHESLDGPLAARVRLVSVDGGGLVTVQVLDPGPRPVYAAGARPVKRNEKLQVPTRSIACPWEQWADRVKELREKQEAQAASSRVDHEEFERRREDRVVADPSRPLPQVYDEDPFTTAYALDEDAAERAALADAYAKQRRLGPYRTARQLEALLIDLPVPVLRDIIAADPHDGPGAAGSVAAVFARAAELLEMARIGMLQHNAGHRTRRPDEIVTQTDAAFVIAVQARVSASGGLLLLPAVPQLPDWVEYEFRETAFVFGWLRLAVADSSGEKLHDAGCTLLHYHVPVLECAHQPWWSVLLADETSLCAHCGGPGLRDLVAFAGFAAAADVWKARGCDRIEDWQQQALQRLVAATAAARAQSSEPDITLGHRAVGALTANPPGEQGWDAYGLCTAVGSRRPTRTARDLPPARRGAAAGLLRERIGVLESVLPEPKPFPQLAPDADVDELRMRYGKLKELLGERVPQLDRLMFTLPGAFWSR